MTSIIQYKDQNSLILDELSNQPILQNCLISAGNDIQAVGMWLNEYLESPNTLRAYKKESKRFLFWLNTETGKDLRSTRREDFAEYGSFLQDSTKRREWFKKHNLSEDESSTWFSESISSASQRQAFVILNAMFSWLVLAGYLTGNPLALMKRAKQAVEKKESQDRFLMDDAWKAVLGYLQDNPHSQGSSPWKKWERERWIFHFLYLVQARRSEAVNAKMSDFIFRNNSWWWRVIGKGNKLAHVPVVDELLEAMKRYRESMGWSPLPSPKEDTPVCLSFNGTSGIKDSMLYKLVCEVFEKVAKSLEDKNPWAAHNLRDASTHWLRHTAATHMMDAGMDLRTVSENLRHSKMSTTMVYQHVEDKKRHNQTQDKLHMEKE